MSNLLLQFTNKFSSIKNQVSDEEMFFGREKTMSDIIEKVSSANTGKSIILYGQMRAGKTTILRFLMQRLRKDSKNIIVNYRALSETSNDSNDKFIYGFFTRFFLLFKNEITYKHKELSEQLKNENIDLDAIEKKLKDENNIDKFITTFEVEFENICNAIKSIKNDYRIFLMCDEFTVLYEWIRKDRIGDKNERERINDRILIILKNLVENYNLIEIIAGHNMLEFADEFANAFGGAEFFKISYLEKNEAMKMMDEPIKYHGKSRYKEDTLERLYELTAGSAYLIVLLCLGLVDFMNKNKYTYVTNMILEEYLEAFLKGNLNTGHTEKTLFEPQYAEFNYIGSEKEEREKRNRNLIKRIADYSADSDFVSINDIAEDKTDIDILNNLEKRDVVLTYDNKCKIRKLQ